MVKADQADVSRGKGEIQPRKLSIPGFQPAKDRVVSAVVERSLNPARAERSAVHHNVGTQNVEGE